ncbi:hypothetical protein JCM16408A_45070 [Methylobacterium phyllosphaerae]
MGIATASYGEVSEKAKQAKKTNAANSALASPSTATMSGSPPAIPDGTGPAGAAVWAMATRAPRAGYAGPLVP